MFIKLAQKFFSIGKKETVNRSQLKPFAEELREEVVSYRKNYQQEDSPSVATITTKEEFERGYKTLQLSSLISTCFIIFISTSVFLSSDPIALMTNIAFLIVGSMWHFSFVVRAFRANEIYKSWDKSSEPYKVSISEVFDAITEDPLLLIPFTRNLKE